MSSSYEPNRLDAVLELFAGTSLPALRRESGYRGATTLVNRDHSRLMSISFWSDGGAVEPFTVDTDAAGDVLSTSGRWTSPLMQETYAVYVCEVRRVDAVSHGAAQARITTLQVNPQYWEALITAGHEATDALEREQPGFLGAIGLGNRATGKASFIELWQNRASLRASEATAYRQERAARAIRMLVGVPQHSTFQVEHFELSNQPASSGDCE